MVSNQEKAALTARLLRGLEAAGVEQVLYMPEPAGICPKACQKMGGTRLLGDSAGGPGQRRSRGFHRAAAAMVEAGVGCIVTLGGDGTNRAVFKGSGSEVPLLPISTGTTTSSPNSRKAPPPDLRPDCWPRAGPTAKPPAPRSKVLWLHDPSGAVDLALVDLAVTTRTFIGARAIWEVDHLKELF